MQAAVVGLNLNPPPHKNRRFRTETPTVRNQTRTTTLGESSFVKND